MIKVLFYLVMFNFLSSMLNAQGNVVILNEENINAIVKSEIQSGSLFKSHSSIKPYSQEYLISQLMVDSNGNNMSLVRTNYEFIHYHNDSLSSMLIEGMKRKPLLRYFNTYPGHFYSEYSDSYYVTLDPILNLELGKESNNENKLIYNTRGIRLKIGIDDKVFLNSEFTENQMSPLSYINDFANTYKAIPGGGFVKAYNSKILKVKNGYDYILAEGSVQFKACKHVDIHLAHGRNFLGQGIRSLLLSDFSAPLFFLKINSHFGRFNYVNIFSELSSENRFINDVDKLLAKKYSATHYLSMNITRNWNFALFESVIFHRKKGFELQYLNPIILYRAVEQALGSPDNVLLGFQSHINLLKKFSLYGQVILDEFVFRRVITNNEGWWANKYGIQLGLKYPDLFGIKGLYAQVEFNSVRPFTYSYSDSLTNYSHYHQALAHPLGSNFKEAISSINYQMCKKVFLQMQLMEYSKGLDTSYLNFGGNILKNNSTRVSDYQNSIGQGLNTKVFQATLRCSFEVLSRTWLDFVIGARQTNNVLEFKKSSWISLGLRMNMDYKSISYL